MATPQGDMQQPFVPIHHRLLEHVPECLVPAWPASAFQEKDQDPLIRCTTSPRKLSTDHQGHVECGLAVPCVGIDVHAAICQEFLHN
eukprot:CAMPEP_0181397964 /NCGR_PEP_ID=MMETSP1110-20121109/778_1 /TAXON_ID=174948 /ORGANISM="Symbiodinium sp., Strain CCMP421" /LENGTH=86 /DNA_ID=CAMNT_0023519863 /DNA_START=328 /DNA_END=588 /DNA_ORIENTATION=-